MADEEKHDNFQEFDKEPATGNLNDAPSDSTNSDSTEQRASSAWGDSGQSEPEKNDTSDSFNVEVKRNEPSGDKPSVAPLHDDIAPATIPMSSRPLGATPNEPVDAKNSDELPKPGPGLLVLQWLTYAFWGWTVLSLSGLVITVVSQLLNQTSENYWLGGIAYLLAAVIVLFIISLVTDIFYASAEKKHSRSNGTNVIMIIHAVIFALFGIGSLIVAVFGFVSLLLNDTSGSTGPMTSIISGVIIAVLYGLTLLRTLRPRWIKAVAPMYWVVMTLAIIVTVTLGIVGPAAQARLQNEDTVVEAGLPDIADSINSYATKNERLPKSLSDLNSLSESAQKLVDENKVTYTPGKELKANSTNSKTNDTVIRAPVAPVFHYELCVDYKAKDGGDSYSYRSSTYDQQYSTSISTYGHKAGHVCYDVQTDYMYDY